MATWVCNVSLQYNQRGMNAAQLVGIIALLRQMQAAGITPKYGVNIQIPTYNDDTGSMTGLVTVTAAKTGDFTEAEITDFTSWITTNVVNRLPLGVSIVKTYTWQPSP